MPALLEQPVVEIEALPRAAAAPLPTVQPHNRHNRRYASAGLLLKGLCLALIAVGVWGRWWQFDQVPGLNGDEAWYGVQAQRFLDEYVYGKTLPEQDRVTFRTPTGNLWNPFLMIPRIVLDARYKPSVMSLRLPALCSGILALLVNWWLCRRAINQTTAWLTTVLLAVLPVAVIYSRLGWDASQSLLFCLPLVYLPWISQREAWSARQLAFCYALALVAAVLVHPTNIFLLPLSAALLWPRLRATAKWELSLRSRASLAGAAIVGAVCLGIARGAWAGVELSNLIAAVTQWAGDLVGMFNGATVYGSISLPVEDMPAASGWLLLLSVPTIALLVWTRSQCKIPFLPQNHRWHTLTNGKGVVHEAATTPFASLRACHPRHYAVMFDGASLAVLCFLGVAGPAAIQPGYERYGLWMIAPISLLIVLAYSMFAHRLRQARVAVTILTMAQVVLLLAGYWQYYQRRFEVPPAEQRLAHWTYRADNYHDWQHVENAELNHCLDKRYQEGPRYIVVDPTDPQRWWFEWKWRYLSHATNSAVQYQWLVLPPYGGGRPAESDSHGWLMYSQPESEKEKLAIRHLW